MTQQSPDAKAETGLGVPLKIPKFHVPELGHVIRYDGPVDSLATVLYFSEWDGGHPKFHLASPREIREISRATKLGSYSESVADRPIITDMVVLTVANKPPLLLRHTPFSECSDYTYARNKSNGLELPNTLFYNLNLRSLANEGNTPLEDRTVYSLPYSINAKGSSYPDLTRFIFGTSISPDNLTINLTPSFPSRGITSLFPLFISQNSPDIFNIFLGNAFNNNNSGYGINHTESHENLIRLLGTISSSTLFKLGRK